MSLYGNVLANTAISAIDQCKHMNANVMRWEIAQAKRAN
jgi:hypothetical protein